MGLEGGGAPGRGPASARRVGLPYTLKLAWTPDWGIRLGGDAWVRDTDENGERISGTGDTSVIGKRRFAIDESSAFGLELGATMPTGRRRISDGKAAYRATGTHS